MKGDFRRLCTVAECRGLHVGLNADGHRLSSIVLRHPKVRDAPGLFEAVIDDDVDAAAERVIDKLLPVG